MAAPIHLSGCAVRVDPARWPSTARSPSTSSLNPTKGLQCPAQDDDRQARRLLCTTKTTYTQHMRRALLVGIDDYPFARLRYCVKDAQDLSDRLSSPECGFEVKLLLDQDATRREILTNLRPLRDEKLEVALLYLAGHGVRTNHGDYFLAVDAVDGDEGIDIQTLFQTLGRHGAAADTRVCLLDFCHSGAARSAIERIGVSLNVDDLKQVVPSSRGTVIMAACEPEQKASEEPSLEHGVFTHYLLSGLDGAASVDGIVTAHGLYAYVARAFGDDERQRPVWRGDIAGSLILADLRTRPRPLPVPPAGIASAEVIQALAEDSGRRLEDYQSRLAVSLQEWRSVGWLQAAGSLAELLHWFERQQTSYPELSRDPDFMLNGQAARGRLAQLANIDIGTTTSYGVATERVGAGAFGSIWKIINDSSDSFAYKVYHPTELHLNEKIGRFERGYRAMKQLVHPSIVRVYEYTQAPLGFFMEYIDGPNIRTLAPANLDPDRIVQLLLGIAEAVHFAHNSGIVHRDIKPENIIVKWDETSNAWLPYLTDFDLAWFSTATQITKEGFGAQFYSAPEQFTRPNADVSHLKTVDVYSFGQLMFYCVVGTDPEPLGLGSNSYVFEDRIESWPLADTQSPLTLYKMCSKFEPSSRPRSMDEIITRLRQIYFDLRDNQSRLSEDEFYHQLLLFVLGFSRRDKEYRGSYITKSGHAEVMIHEGASWRNGLSFDVQIRRLVKDSSNQTADLRAKKRRLKRRVEAAISAYDSPRPNYVDLYGTDELLLKFFDVPLTQGHLAKSSALVSDVLAVFEG